VTKVVESPLWQISSFKESMELMGQHCSVKRLAVAPSKDEVSRVPSRAPSRAFIFLPNLVIPQFADRDSGQSEYSPASLRLKLDQLELAIYSLELPRYPKRAER
jgi:hypothetical protein